MVARKLDIFGKNSLVMYSFQYYFLAAFTYIGYIWPEKVHPWMLICFAYAILPLLDEIFSLDWRNPTEEERQELERRNPWFVGSLYLALILDWIAFFRFLRFVATVELTLSSIVYFAAYFYIVTILGAVSFLVAHEIFHKPGWFNYYLGTLHMSKVLYMHFTIEHLFGHHKNVATPTDPATAQKGMALYSFVPRSIIGSWLSAYSIEQKSEKPVYLNGAVLSIISSILLTGLVAKYFGAMTALVFLAYGLGSIFYLENINYIEHYGLQRKKLPDGTYEKVTIRHSWNAPHRFTNYIMFKLQRHSDHHENSLKPYQTLLSLEDSPNLPHGYSIMVLMSMFPPVWFKIMDPLVD